MVPRGGNLTYNGDPRVGKLTFENLKMSNFPLGCLAPPSWGKPLTGVLRNKTNELLACSKGNRSEVEGRRSKVTGCSVRRYNKKHFSHIQPFSSNKQVLFKSDGCRFLFMNTPFNSD